MLVAALAKASALAEGVGDCWPDADSTAEVGLADTEMLVVELGEGCGDGVSAAVLDADVLGAVVTDVDIVLLSEALRVPVSLVVADADCVGVKLGPGVADVVGAAVRDGVMLTDVVAAAVLEAVPDALVVRV